MSRYVVLRFPWDAVIGTVEGADIHDATALAEAMYGTWLRVEAAQPGPELEAAITRDMAADNMEYARARGWRGMFDE